MEQGTFGSDYLQTLSMQSRPLLQSALSVKLEREADLGARRSQYDDLTTKLRASDERRLGLERELEPLRQRIVDECLVAYLHDGVDAWDLQPDGSYVLVKPADPAQRHGAQAALMARYSPFHHTGK